MTVREHLEAIHATHGQLTPELVVAEAREDDHPLHAFVFDPPPGAAAEAWYRYRAHRLIQSVSVTFNTEDGARKTW